MAVTSLDRLTQLVAEGMVPAEKRESLGRETEEAIKGLFGERYPARSAWARRIALMPNEDNVSFAGLLHPDSPTSGPYGGMSLIWFPASGEDEKPPSSLLTFVCGTRGLSPDEQILGRPGHARNLRALRRYLTERHGTAIWTKHDPTNLAQPIPEVVRRQYRQYSPVFARTGTSFMRWQRFPKNPQGRGRWSEPSLISMPGNAAGYLSRLLSRKSRS